MMIVASSKAQSIPLRLYWTSCQESEDPTRTCVMALTRLPSEVSSTRTSIRNGVEVLPGRHSFVKIRREDSCAVRIAQGVVDSIFFLVSANISSADIEEDTMIFRALVGIRSLSSGEIAGETVLHPQPVKPRSAVPRRMRNELFAGRRFMIWRERVRCPCGLC